MKKTQSLIALTLILVLSLSVAGIGAAEAGEAPIAENLEISTYRNVSVGGWLKATAPKGGTLKFEITTPPSKGELLLSDDGSFVYTPAENKKGRDYFGFKAVDEAGFRSSEGTVIIRIEKQKTSIAYSDMEGKGAHFAAVSLAERDIFVGERVGGLYLFSPDTPVTRSEFLTICMKLAEADILSGVLTTGFADDGEIPNYLKPYVSTALLSGMISGYANGHSAAVFNGENLISYPEAAVMLNKALSLTDVSTATYINTAPVWAEQSVSNLSACRIADYMDETQLTRADCAVLISRAMKLVDK